MDNTTEKVKGPRYPGKGGGTGKRKSKAELAKGLIVPDVIDPNRRYSISVSSILLGQSVAQTYIDCKAGRLQLIKDGARSFLHGSNLIERSLPGARGAA